MFEGPPKFVIVNGISVVVCLQTLHMHGVILNWRLGLFGPIF